MKNKKYMIVDVNHSMPIYPHTLGQFTGRKDIKGTKIFEDDIVKTPTNRVYKIIWVDSTRYVGFDLQFLFGSDNSISDEDIWSNLTVIGNLYDGIFQLNK